MRTMTASQAEIIISLMHATDKSLASIQQLVPEMGALVKLAQDCNNDARKLLLRVALSDIEVEPSAPEREQVMGEAA